MADKPRAWMTSGEADTFCSFDIPRFPSWLYVNYCPPLGRPLKTKPGRNASGKPCRLIHLRTVVAVRDAWQALHAEQPDDQKEWFTTGQAGQFCG